jgi:hypothetical protein
MNDAHEALTCRDPRCEPHHSTEALLDWRDDLSQQIARLAETYGERGGSVREAKYARRGLEIAHRQLVEVTDALRDRGLAVGVPASVDEIKRTAQQEAHA